MVTVSLISLMVYVEVKHHERRKEKEKKTVHLKAIKISLIKSLDILNIYFKCVYTVHCHVVNVKPGKKQKSYEIIIFSYIPYF